MEVHSQGKFMTLTANYSSLAQACQHIIEQMSNSQLDEKRLLATIKQAVQQFPDSAELLFLFGSELAQQQQYQAAIDQLTRAVELNPEFKIARFQLCLLLVNGQMWSLFEPHVLTLKQLPESDFLHHFAQGLHLLVQQPVELAQLAAAKDFLHSGIELNKENQALNLDITAMIERIGQQQQQIQQQDNTELDETAQATQPANPSASDNSVENQQEKTSGINQSLLLDIYKTKH